MPAARHWAAVRSLAPAKTWEYFDGIFQGKLAGKLGDAYYDELSRRQELSPAVIDADLDSPTVTMIIDADNGEFDRLGVNVVPTFFLNGVLAEEGPATLEKLDSDIAKLESKRFSSF